MQDLIQYIENGELDNAKLLDYFELYGWNKLLAQSMRRTTANRDKYIRYEIFKMLSEDLKAKYTQKLELIATEEAASEKQESEDESEADAADAREVDAEDVQKSDIPDDAEKSEWVQQKAKCYNERAKLSNTLADFSDDDNEGRKEVLYKIELLDVQIVELNQLIAGEQVAKPKGKSELDFLKPDAEKANMTDMEIRGYKKTLGDRRGKASAAVKRGEKVEQNQYIMDIIDKERLTLG